MLINLNTIKNQDTKEVLKSTITDPKIFANILRTILKTEDLVDQDREHFWVIGLNVKNKILYIELLSLGTRNQTLADPAEIFRLAIMKGAASIICGHNHPSGDASPSEADDLLMKKIISAAGLIGIGVLDHIIIGETDYYSYKSTGKISGFIQDIRSISPEYQELEANQPEEDHIVIGRFSDNDNFSNQYARILSKGDISTIFDQLSNTTKTLDKIEAFTSLKCIMNEAALLAEDAGNTCLFLSKSVRHDSDFQDLVNLLLNIEDKLRDCSVYLRLLRDIPDIENKLQHKQATCGTSRPGL